jgi:aspartyl-tRNA(Asn)/glutamyl-tRNA(Gln) amidotransferase subunit A
MLAPWHDGAARSAWQPPYDAAVVARLRQADAVLIGKCNLDELSMGSSTEHSAFGPTHNPWDRSRTPGGSSGGSAAAVAAGLVPAALGTDTGGSVRQPAALSGVVGLKPSYGRVSRYGLIAFASSLDQVGTLTHDVRSAALLLEVIGGPDRHDATTVRIPVPGLLDACGGADLTGVRIGVADEYFAPGIAAEVEAAVRHGIAILGSLGARIVPIRLPHTRYAIACYYVLCTAEASSNLARFDGTRFGWRLEDAGGGGIEAMLRATRGRGFGAEVKRRIVMGTFVLSEGYAEAYYGRAQRLRTLVCRDFDSAFAGVDLVAAPVSPTVAFPLGSRRDDPLAMYLADAYTVPASLGGLPAISVPCGLGSDSGLPVGLQLIAPAFGEARLLGVAHAFEQASPARGARPAGYDPAWPAPTGTRSPQYAYRSSGRCADGERR